ncbi:MAG: hypothetical protein A2583_08945 [Bdellovibrionales bacterium RIFOXYD1_FULL_53_11]|nr:MAG: hypothetical protein A2583_08945 [Bdellovibrionales bacterium RIFOXYD1_FULL_53_11]
MRQLLIIIACTIFCIAGCSFSKKAEDIAPGNPAGGSGSPTAQPAPNPGSAFNPVDGWITEKESNLDLAELTTARMTPAERERTRNEVTRNNILSMNSKTGYSIYKVSGSQYFEKNAFIMPKVLVIGSADGGRASLRQLPGGKVALTIPIALIDGSQRELSYSTTRIRIPENLYINEERRAVIRKELVEMFGYEHELSSLGTCPKKIVIKIAGVDHNVTPTVFGEPNSPSGCQPNQPFTVTLQGSRKYIERFLSDDVFNGAAEVAAMYEVAGSFVDEIRLYMLKTAPHYAKLKSKLVVAGEKGEERKEISATDADQLLGEYTGAALSKWIGKERFFDRVKNTAIAQMKLVYFDEKSGAKGITYALKDETAFKPYDVPVKVVSENLGRQGELFYSSSIIKPILNSTNIAIRGEERQDLLKPPVGGITQNVFTVNDGDEYELQLTSLVVHEYEFSDELTQPKIQDKGLVCIDKPGESLPACRKIKNECIEYKNFCKRPKIGCLKFGFKYDCWTEYNFSPLGCLALGLFGGCKVERKCGAVPDPTLCLEVGTTGCEESGDYCSQTHQICEPGFDEPLCKNQITDLKITRYFSAPAPINYRVVNAPLGNTDQDAIGGLTFRFKWPDGKVVDCLALALMKEVVGQSIRFRVKNNNYCKPFPEGYTGSPVLAIVNRISSERKDIPCGIMNFSTIEGTKYYGCNGFGAVDLTPDQYRAGEPVRPTSFSRSALHLTYYPVVDINGILISRSGAFTSGATHEDEWKELK